jgi:hypothetical protein
LNWIILWFENRDRLLIYFIILSPLSFNICLCLVYYSFNYLHYEVPLVFVNYHWSGIFYFKQCTAFLINQREPLSRYTPISLLHSNKSLICTSFAFFDHKYKSLKFSFLWDSGWHVFHPVKHPLNLLIKRYLRLMIYLFELAWWKNPIKTIGVTNTELFLLH